jgi:hypothetical protein
MTRADVVEKDWSFAKVMMEHERAIARGQSGPDLPLFQWNALRDLDTLKAQFEAGDGFALLQAIRKCANHNLVMPDWVTQNYIDRFDRVLNCKLASWDEAFGKPYPKGKHISNLRDRRSLRLQVYIRVREILAADKSIPIDNELFSSVGAKLGIRKTLCNELYYEAKRMLPSLK